MGIPICLALKLHHGSPSVPILGSMHENQLNK